MLLLLYLVYIPTTQNKNRNASLGQELTVKYTFAGTKGDTLSPNMP